MRLSETVAGTVHAVKGGWEVRSAEGPIVGSIQTRGTPPSLQLRCDDGQWLARWDEDAGAMVAVARRAAEASLTASTFGADAVLRREPSGAEVKLDLRRLPRRRWYLGVNTTITKGREDGALLSFNGRAEPVLLLLALWHVAIAEGDDPSERALFKPQPLADRAMPGLPGGTTGSL